jgi:ribosomal-protein-serine acetyltransferase
MAQIIEKKYAFEITDEINIREICLSDTRDIFYAIDSQREYLGKFLPFVKTTRTARDTESFIKSIVDTPRLFRELVFVIHYKGEFAGLIGFKGTDRLNKKTEIGYWLSEPFQKKGIISKSADFLTKYAFEELDINRVQIKCAVTNQASIAVPKKLGYTFEGIERAGELLSNDEFVDAEVWSKLKTD